jgi:hypothetical protein
MIMEVTVRYDMGKMEIYVPVYVEKPHDNSQLPQVCTPPLVIPQGTWTVIWQLAPSEYAQFDNAGVTKHDPEDLANLDLTCEVSEDRRTITATATNNVKAPNACGVDLHFLDPALNKSFTHDPTIAVTPDPLEPPRHSYS